MLLSFRVLFLLFETGSHSAALSGFKLTVFLSQPLKGWGYSQLGIWWLCPSLSTPALSVYQLCLWYQVIAKCRFLSRESLKYIQFHFWLCGPRRGLSSPRFPFVTFAAQREELGKQLIEKRSQHEQAVLSLTALGWRRLRIRFGQTVTL